MLSFTLELRDDHISGFDYICNASLMPALIPQLHFTRILLYRKDGDKYTGQWDDWKGQGEINYKDGTKYIGQWDRLKRQGQGTLYSADGQVLNQGKWEDNEYKGKK